MPASHAATSHAPAVIRAVYQRLFEAFGPQQWWPAESPFEVMVGAVLVQNTAWKNVERAIGQLRDAGALSPDALHRLPLARLRSLVRPAGTYRVKARRLKCLMDFLFDQYSGSVDSMLEANPDVLRRQLLAVHGIGPETADSILLYARNVPSFVVDTYTRRVFGRHLWVDYFAPYDKIKTYFEANTPADAALYNELHALLVRVGIRYCRKTPRCQPCPLAGLLPADGACLETR